MIYWYHSPKINTEDKLEEILARDRKWTNSYWSQCTARRETVLEIHYNRHLFRRRLLIDLSILRFLSFEFTEQLLWEIRNNLLGHQFLTFSFPRTSNAYIIFLLADPYIYIYILSYSGIVTFQTEIEVICLEILLLRLCTARFAQQLPPLSPLSTHPNPTITFSTSPLYSEGNNVPHVRSQARCEITR